MQAVRHYFQLLLTLEHTKEEDRRLNVATEAEGLLKQLNTLAFIAWLEICEESLGSTSALSNYLQASTTDTIQAAKIMKSTLASIQSMHSDEAFVTKLNAARQIAALINKY